MIELATKTMTADSRMGSAKDVTGTIVHLLVRVQADTLTDADSTSDAKL
jgi:hypothetical protein